MPAPVAPGIPDFDGDTVKADYAFTRLADHMAQHNAGWDDVDSLVIMCDDLSAVTWLLDRMGAAAALARCRVTIASDAVRIDVATTKPRTSGGNGSALLSACAGTPATRRRTPPSSFSPAPTLTPSWPLWTAATM